MGAGKPAPISNMADMATVPVFACKYCGKPVYVTHLSSMNDADASKLRAMMQNLHKIALCKECKRRYNYFASQGRANEFWTNPETVIYAVVDPSGLDYYGRKDE